jgi:hypothetical protein
MQKRAARLLGEGVTQEQAAAAVGVTSRTPRNWKAAPAFRRELERAQQLRRQRRPGPARPRTTKRPARRGADERQRRRGSSRQPRLRLRRTCRAASAGSPACRSGATATDGPAHPRNMPSATLTTPPAATSPRPTATTTTPSSGLVAKQQPNGAPSAKRKNEAAATHNPRGTSQFRQTTTSLEHLLGSSARCSSVPARRSSKRCLVPSTRPALQVAGLTSDWLT